jgi:hypothetical protein
MIDHRECLGAAADGAAPLALAPGLLRPARKSLCLLISAACCVGCTTGAKPNALPAEAAVAPPIDRVDLFVRNAAREAVQLTLTRDTLGGTETWHVRRSDERQRPLGPAEQDTDMVVRMLSSFDIWALNAPDAPGAACRTVMGQRSCAITFNDYSLVMRVQRGRQVRVQRYTHLEKSRSNQSARALADFVFAWARTRERRDQCSIIKDVETVICWSFL